MLLANYGIALTYLGIILIGVFPILSVLLCAALAKLCGCRVDESKPHPCKCLGVEIGGLLYFLGVLGWLTLLTVPLGGILLVVYSFRLLVWGV